jgi:hypothetical protein
MRAGRSSKDGCKETERRLPVQAMSLVSFMVRRQSIIRAATAGSGLTGADRPPRPDLSNSNKAFAFRGKVERSAVVSMTQHLTTASSQELTHGQSITTPSCCESYAVQY